MSDDQLQALGLPRREFLKRAAIGAGVFAVPVVVSFGLGGTAEARSCFPNQGLANQEASQLGSIVINVWTQEQNNRVETTFARQLRRRLLDAEGKLLDGDVKAACDRIADALKSLAREAGKRIDASLANVYVNQLNSLSSNMGCAACT